MTSFVLYTDGGYCRTGEAPQASWSFVVHQKGKEDRFIHEFGLVNHHKQTSQTGEMSAIIQSLKYIEQTLCQGDIFAAQNVSLEVISDSQYCVNGAMDWMHKWKKNNWADKENIDLWKIIYSLTVNTFKSVNYKWVRGHDGNKFNELADLGCNIALGRLTKEQAYKKWENYV